VQRIISKIHRAAKAKTSFHLKFENKYAKTQDKMKKKSFLINELINEYVRFRKEFVKIELVISNGLASLLYLPLVGGDNNFICRSPARQIPWH
jgi:hypothetical protein